MDVIEDSTTPALPGEGLKTEKMPGNHVALLIVKLDTHTAGDVQLRGWVQSIGAEQWTIGGPPGSMAPAIMVRIKPSTTIYTNPKVGDLVLVTGTRDWRGVITATKIAKLD